MEKSRKVGGWCEEAKKGAARMEIGVRECLLLGKIMVCGERVCGGEKRCVWER
jgi:hypothetical protein